MIRDQRAGPHWPPHGGCPGSDRQETGYRGSGRLNSFRLGGLLVALLLLLALPLKVRAHAELVRSDPPAGAVLQQSPDQLQLWFNEPIEAGFSTVQLLDATGQQVDLGDGRVLADEPRSMVLSLPSLEEGTYTVAWRALSTVDGHVTQGLFSFSIGVASASPVPSPAPPELPEGLFFELPVRWAGYLAAVLALGLLLFRQLLLLPIGRRLGMEERLREGVHPSLVRLARLGWAAFLLGTLASLLLQLQLASGANSLAEASGSLGPLLFGTRFGQIWMARLGLVLALGLTLWRLAPERPVRWWLGIALGAAILLTTSLNSHSAASQQASFALLLAWIHLLAMALWVGGLLGLTILLPPLLRSLPSPERWRLLAALIGRFSLLALLAVGALVATGLYQSWLHIGGVEAAGATLYGRSFLLKLLLLVPLLLLGALNLLYIRPRVAASVEQSGQATRLHGQFAWFVRAEVIAALLVLLVTGLLTSLPPARQSYERLLATRPLIMEDEAAGLQLALTITPARPGPNHFLVQVRDSAGQPVEDAERVTIFFDYLDSTLGTSSIEAEAEGAGRYVAEDSIVALEGRWQAELLVRRAGQEDARTAFRFRISESGAAEEEAASQMTPSSPVSLPGIRLGIAGGLLLLGVGLLFYIRRAFGLKTVEGGVMLLASGTLVALALFLVVQLPPAQTGSAVSDTARNPFPPTGESLARGEQLYRENCQSCHGESGGGDGPAAPILNPPPANLQEHMAAGHQDQEIFHWISEGVPGSAMPAFEEQLSVEERWHVINFIKTFARGEE